MTGDDDTLTWHDREVIGALRRLASARSRLDQLLDGSAEGSEPAVSLEDVAELDQLEEEIAALAAKSRARFGGGPARERRATLQARQRAILERLGMPDVAAARAAAADTSEPDVDPLILDFARRELAAAEEAWEELQSMEVPEPPDEDEQAATADEVEHAGAPEEIDLRVHPPAAS